MAEADKPEGLGISDDELQPKPERLLGERAGLYPIEGRDLIEEINEVEIGEKGETKELKETIKEVLAFRHGLVFGPEGENVYNLEDGGELIYLENLFTTVEASSARPNAFYLETALNEAVEGRVRRAVRWNRRSKDADWKKDWEERTRKAAQREIERRQQIRVLSGQSPLTSEEMENEVDKVVKIEKIILTREEGILTNEYKAVSKLVDFENQINAHRIIDTAFIQRMGVCEVGGTAVANLLNQDRRYQPPATPDKGHWQAFFGAYEVAPGKMAEGYGFGKDVDRTLREIVRVAYRPKGQETPRFGEEEVSGGVKEIEDVNVGDIPASIYAEGMENTKDFKKWLRHLLKTADNRMDVVWAAWRIAMMWELPAQLGKAIEHEVDVDKETKEVTVTKRVQIAPPPVGNSIGPWVMQLDDKQRIEWGLDAGGRRTVVERYPTHTGYPLNFLGPDAYKKVQEAKGVAIREIKRRNPCESFLHESKVDREGGRKTLFDIWWGEDGRTKEDGGTGISFADKDFPWILTEAQRQERDIGELSPGSFGAWLLRRFRAWSVVQDIRSRPPLREISDPDFFADRARNWGKVFGTTKNIKPGKEGYREPWERPQTWWVAGLVHAHYKGGAAKDLVRQNEKELDYRAAQRGEYAELREVGIAERGASIKDILQNAVTAGFLRDEDRNWIVENIGG